MNAAWYDYINSKMENANLLCEHLDVILEAFALYSHGHDPDYYKKIYNFSDLGIGDEILCHIEDSFENGDEYYSIRLKDDETNNYFTAFLMSKNYFYYTLDFLLEYYPTIKIRTSFDIDKEYLDEKARKREEFIKSTHKDFEKYMPKEENTTDKNENKSSNNSTPDDSILEFEKKQSNDNLKSGFFMLLMIIVVIPFTLLAIIYFKISDGKSKDYQEVDSDYVESEYWDSSSSDYFETDDDENEDYQEQDSDYVETIYPDSSAIEYMAYNYDQNILIILFNDGEYPYAYYDFPEYEWENFKDADSKGGFFHEYIRDQYDYEKCDN